MAVVILVFLLADRALAANKWGALAIYVQKTLGSNEDAGAVSVLSGSDTGLTGKGSLLTSRQLPNIIGNPHPQDFFGKSLVAGDFDGDGYKDLTVGIWGEDIAGSSDAGAVNVIYRISRGPAAFMSQIWSQHSYEIRGISELEDLFGYSMSTGDYNGDGNDDLIVGVPYEDIGGSPDAGAINVIYGSASGLSQAGNQVWSQHDPEIQDAAEAYDLFGCSLASGDFNGDGYDDIAIGVKGEDRGGITDSGAINIVYGSPQGLNNGLGDQLWDQNQLSGSPEDSDFFGSSLIAIDFNGDGFDDLAVGVPYEDLQDYGDDCGVVNIIYGSANGLTSEGNLYFTADFPRADDQFGYVLASGDFDGDSFGDLAISAYRRTISGKTLAGAVEVLYGTSRGLAIHRRQQWHQDQTGILGESDFEDLFGIALAAGDFNLDGYCDLAIGVPQEDTNYMVNAGAVNIIYGRPEGLAIFGNQLWTLDTENVQGQAEANDYFGLALAYIAPDKVFPWALYLPAIQHGNKVHP